MPRKKADSRPSGRPVIDWWLVAAIAVPALYFHQELLGFNVFAGIDTSRLNMPLRMFDREMFAAGAVPLWNPYMFAGFPHLAESESGTFYPGNVFIHLPGDFFHWYSVEVVVHFMIAAAGFYTWMRLRGQDRPVSAILAATYCTTPFLIFHITAFGLFTSIVWLPWYFVIFEWGMRSFQPLIAGLCFALFLGFMLMAGSVQSAFLGTLGLLLYSVGTVIGQPDRVGRKRALIRVLAVLVPALFAPVTAAVQILPTVELTRFSERAATDSLEFFRLGTWLSFSRLYSLVVFPALDNPAEIQDYGSSLVFLGSVPFALAVSSLTQWRAERRELFPILFAGVIALLLGFGLNLPGYSLLVKVPPFSMFRYPGRAEHVAFTFFLALAAPAAGAMWHPGFRAGTAGSRGLGLALGALIAMAAGGIALGLGGIVAGGAKAALVLAALALAAGLACASSASARFRSFERCVVAFLLLVNLAAQILLTYPFSRVLVQKRPMFEKSLQFFDDILADFPTDMEIPRVIMPGGHSLMDPNALSRLGFEAQEDIWDNMSGNASGLRHVTSLSALTPLNQNSWKVILRDILQSQIDREFLRAKEEGRPPVADEISLRIFRMLGADVLLLEGDNWVVPGYELWRSDLSLPFHEGLAAYRAVGGWVPDSFFAEGYHAGSRDVQPLGVLAAQQFDPCREPFLDSFHTRPASPLGRGTVLGRERGPNWLRFRVSVEASTSLLVTGENFFPGWKAYIDGSPNGEIVRANFLLSGVWVPAGEHTVELRYEPQSFKTGAFFSVAGVIVWLVLMMAEIARERGERKIRNSLMKGLPIGFKE